MEKSRSHLALGVTRLTIGIGRELRNYIPQLCDYLSNSCALQFTIFWQKSEDDLAVEVGLWSKAILLQLLHCDCRAFRAFLILSQFLDQLPKAE